MKLLIADDNPSMRALFRQLCDGVATEMRDCSNGAEAVALYKDFQPDWTLMDLAMPEMDGLVATTQIRKVFPGARIIIVTHQRGPEYQQAALNAGACAFILKDDLHSLPSLLLNASTHQKS